jgi:hypothetical protein
MAEGYRRLQTVTEGSFSRTAFSKSSFALPKKCPLRPILSTCAVINDYMAGDKELADKAIHAPLPLGIHRGLLHPRFSD